MPIKDIYYSDKYTDDTYEYRHVMLPKVGLVFVCVSFCKLGIVGGTDKVLGPLNYVM